jgi:hypothetical protein
MMMHRMGAECTLLTHFSQRYPKLPSMTDGSSSSSSSRPLGIAFDLMSVRFNQLTLLPILYPALRCLFPSEPNDDDDDDNVVNAVMAPDGDEDEDDTTTNE